MKTFAATIIAVAASGAIGHPLGDGSVPMEACIFGIPLVMTKLTREQKSYQQSNLLVKSSSFPGPEFKSIIRPNRDTLYSTMWLDLSRSPVTISIPDTSNDDNSRMYILPFMDAYTNVFETPGWRTTGREAIDILVEWDSDNAPNHDLDAGSFDVHIKSPTSLGYLIGRTAVQEGTLNVTLEQMRNYSATEVLSTGPEDLGNETEVLSLEPENGVGVGFDGAKTPLDIIEDMSAQEFFERLCGLMEDNPPASNDASLVERFNDYGLCNEWSTFPWWKQRQLNSGKDTGFRRSRLGVQKNITNGWASPDPAIGNYGTDYLLRANIALVGYGAVTTEDAMYFGRNGVVGNAYELVFSSDVPMIDGGFWSLTLYKDGYLFENEAEVYNIASHQDLAYRSDGDIISITISDTKPADNTTNWLPSPSPSDNIRGSLRQFSLLFRLYSPGPEAQSGEWVPAELQTIDIIVL